MDEYAVMKQIGDQEPEVYEDGFETYEQADRVRNKAYGRLDDLIYEGVRVYSAEDAQRAAKELELVKSTRYFVAKSQVTRTPWEEAWD